MVQGREEFEHQGAKYAKEKATAAPTPPEERLRRPGVGGDQNFGILNPYPAGAASSPRLPLRALRLGVQIKSFFA
jgi:hypothetical protein